MPVLLITYDLNQETRRPPILEKIKEIGNEWAKLSESSYAIKTSLNAKQVYDALSPMLDSNDSCIVIPLSPPFWGRSKYQDVIPWLQQRL